MTPPENASRTGIFGGSFDPVHAGHLALAQACQEALGLERILIVPTRNPPHKSGIHASDEQRLHMLRLAFEGMPAAEISDYELGKTETCYTFDLLRHFHGKIAGDLYFLLGEDALYDLPKWHRYPELLSLAHWAAVCRAGAGKPANASERSKDHPIFKVFERKKGTSLTLIQANLPDVSSSAIRERLRAGQSIAGLVPAGVEAYLKRTGLYVSPKR